MGATHTVNSSETDPVEAIKAICSDDGSDGADVVIDAVAVRRRGSRRSTPATSPARSSWSAFRLPT